MEAAFLMLSGQFPMVERLVTMTSQSGEKKKKEKNSVNLREEVLRIASGNTPWNPTASSSKAEYLYSLFVLFI